MSILPRVAELATEFRAKADFVDQGTEPPREQLEMLAQSGYFKFAADAEPGPRRRSLDLLSSGCGVTAFTATQHEGVCRRLQKAGHRFLEEAVTGQRWFGVCFAHLRRQPSPVEAIEFRSHVVYSGSGPWFTGHGLLDWVMVGGATESGRFLMGVSPVEIPEVVVRPLPQLAVMNATATVGLDFNALSVAKEDIIVDTDAAEMAEKDMHSTVFQSARSLGAARAASLFLPDSARQEVEKRLEEQHLKMDAWDSQPSWDTATTLRQEALTFASEAVGAAYMNVGGKAHVLHHPLQRISREASFYSTTQLTSQLRDAVTKRLEDSALLVK